MEDDRFPQWATWVAMEDDGAWWCYEVEPHMYSRGWYENEVGRRRKVENSIMRCDNWRNSLRKIK